MNGLIFPGARYKWRTPGFVAQSETGVLGTTSPRSAIIRPLVGGTIPTGISVPIHSHSDIENFFVVSGAVQVLSHEAHRFKWLDAKAGDFIQVPSNVKHAFRNTSSEPVKVLITTTPEIGKFFQEVGRPVYGRSHPQPPGPDELEHFARAAARYHHWLGSPAENAEIGISFGH